MDKNNIFISYVVPCYNVQKYLPACLESLSMQKIIGDVDIEYILVNDGSKDDTLRLLKEFEASDNRATVVDQKNQGVCAARNAGLKLAKGKYVYFHDGDDILTERASQLVYDESIKQEPDIIIPNALIVEESDLESTKDWNTFGGFEPGLYPTKDFVTKIKSLPISVKVYKRETLVQNGITFDVDLKVGEVYTFFFHVLAYSKYVTMTEGRMMKWVVRSEGTTKGEDVKRDIQIVNSIHRIDSYANEFPFDVRSYESYQNSLYGIANTFSFGKYPHSFDYTQEIGRFLTTVRNDKVYKGILRYYLFRNPHFGRRYLNIALLYFFPVKVYYLKARLGLFTKLKNCLKPKVW